MIVALSPRRRRMITAPVNSNTAPVAASGTRTGAMPSAAGTIRPAAARNSRAPMALRAPGLKSSTHLEAAPPIPASFSLGTNSLVLLATRKTTARIPATIHRARFSLRFMRISLKGYRRFPLPGYPGSAGTNRVPDALPTNAAPYAHAFDPGGQHGQVVAGRAARRVASARDIGESRGDPDHTERARPHMHNDGPRR